MKLSNTRTDKLEIGTHDQFKANLGTSEFNDIENTAIRAGETIYEEISVTSDLFPLQTEDGTYNVHVTWTADKVWLKMDCDYCEDTRMNIDQLERSHFDLLVLYLVGLMRDTKGLSQRST